MNFKTIVPGHQYIHDSENKLSFQQGPVKEVGVNGIQNEDIMEVLLDRLNFLNKSFPCKENTVAITHLETSLLWLKRRTELRELQKVEGSNQPHVS